MAGDPPSRLPANFNFGSNSGLARNLPLPHITFITFSIEYTHVMGSSFTGKDPSEFPPHERGWWAATRPASRLYEIFLQVCLYH
jgi:hypothetical protein